MPNLSAQSLYHNFPKGPYDIVLADPPWHHYGSATKDAAAGKHYDLLTQEELALLPVRDSMMKKAALFLWVTCPRLNFGIEIIEKWGLHYRGVAYIWVKTRKDGAIISGQGVPPTFTKPTTELVLAATTTPRGRPFPIHCLNQPQVILAPRGAHSVKPPVVRTLIEQLCGDRPRVELFARDKVPGWDAWGNEIQ